MGKVMIVLMAVLLTVSIYMPVMAQENVVTAAKTVVSGEIVSIDADKGSIVVKQIKDEAAKTTEDLTIEVTADAKITKAEAVLKIADLKAGEKVTVNAKTEEGKLKAETITVG